MDVININNLSFGYSDKLILDNVSFSLKKGWTSIVGPNGVGKSTLLNLMNGLIKPDKGHITILDNHLAKLSTLDKAKLFTTIHQQDSIAFPITCFELISQGRYPINNGSHRLYKEDYEVIYNVMQETQTYEFRDKLVTHLSGGEKQRVLLALALVQEPKILYIDEGFSALDIKHKKLIIKCLKKRVETKNLVVIAIIHDLNIAYQISDRILLMDLAGCITEGETRLVMTKESIESLYETQINYHEDYGFSMSM